MYLQNGEAIVDKIIKRRYLFKDWNLGPSPNKVPAQRKGENEQRILIFLQIHLIFWDIESLSLNPLYQIIIIQKSYCFYEKNVRM